MKINVRCIVTGLLFSLSLPVHAHTGLGAVHGFTEGLLHPLMGLDHALVMIAIGIWAAILGGKALWQVPLSFLTLMSIGASLQFMGFTLPAAEMWIAYSVIIIGLLIGSNYRTSSALASALVGLLALSHGFAHATEIADNAAALPYAIGFLISTAVLHFAGWLSGRASKSLAASTLMTVRIGFGVIYAVFGAVFLAGV